MCSCNREPEDDSNMDMYECEYAHEVGMDDAREYNRQYATSDGPDYFGMATNLARREFTPEMFQDEKDSDFVKFTPESDADVATYIVLGVRDEFGNPTTKEEADRMLEQTRLEGLAYKAWLAREKERAA